MITKGLSVTDIAQRRLGAARGVFAAGVRAYALNLMADQGAEPPEADVVAQVLQPLRREDPFVLEAVRLDWGSRAAALRVLDRYGLLQDFADRSVVGRTVMLTGPIHGPLHRPSQPIDLTPLSPSRMAHAFAAHQAFVRYCHAVTGADGSPQLGEHPPAVSAQHFVDHLADWEEAPLVLAYDEVARDAYAWPFSLHPAACERLYEVTEAVATVLDKSPVLRDQRLDLQG